MGNLVLQMQSTVDGYASTGDWQLWDWGPVWPWDAALRRDFNDAYENIGRILITTNMARDGYSGHWSAMAASHRDDAEWRFAQKVTELEKVIASRSSRTINGQRTLDGTRLREEVTQLKHDSPLDIMCFGGTGFADALLGAGLVDQIQLYVNPALVGHGHKLFPKSGLNVALRLETSRAYDCGMLVTTYAPDSR